MLTRIKDFVISISIGVVITFVGIFFTGYSTAIAMPKFFSNIIWLWDIFIVQLLGFGLSAIFFGFLSAKIFKVNPLIFVIGTLSTSQVIIGLLSGGYNVFYIHLIVLTACLSLGVYFPSRKYA